MTHRGAPCIVAAQRLFMDAYVSDEQHFDYDRMVEDAMRGLVRQALRKAAAEGLQGEHHFYISFRTDAEDVGIPPRLKAQYPQEITIVLQHQFWNLDVGKQGFSVELAFAGKRERLDVPYMALTGFADPSAQFGVKFGAEKKATAANTTTDATAGATVKMPPATAGDKAGGDKAGGDRPADKPGEKVVSLDQFRKK